MNQSTKEIWKPVMAYNGYYSDCYEVSNMGRVRSLDKITCDGRPIKGKILRHGYSRGYPCVQLSKDNILRHAEIHRLVAISFIPNPTNLPCVNHKDQNIKNNNVDNLEWCTHKYNSNYGTCISQRVSKESKRIIAKNIKTQEEIIYPSLSACTRAGFNQGGIYKVMIGSYPHHKGYIFYYPDDPDWLQTHRKNTRYGAIYAISEIDGTRIDFKSIEATAKHGFMPPSVSKALKRENNLYKNYKWYYK